MMSAMRTLVVVLALLAACDGDAWSPRAEHDRATARLAAELAAHLETLPGVREASVVLTLPFADPLAADAPSHPALASVVLALEAGADPAGAEYAARAAVEAAVAGARVTVLAAAEEKAAAPGRYRAALAGALAVIAGLALWIVWIYRRAARAQ
jgi:type III secretory pathway lipoprotein EscJ